ncbi:MAG TPA: hypothetical protein VEQ15_00410 [Myxococcales bacterium]|nr:hypothetical protein [Myxococcales bacterium]
MARYDHLLDPTQAPEGTGVELRNEDEFLALISEEQKIVDRYASLLTTAEGMRPFLGDAETTALKRTLAAWARLHWQRVGELTKEREQLLKHGPGRPEPVVRPHVQPAPAQAKAG